MSLVLSIVFALKLSIINNSKQHLLCVISLFHSLKKNRWSDVPGKERENEGFGKILFLPKSPLYLQLQEVITYPLPE